MKKLLSGTLAFSRKVTLLQVTRVSIRQTPLKIWVKRSGVTTRKDFEALTSIDINKWWRYEMSYSSILASKRDKIWYKQWKLMSSREFSFFSMRTNIFVKKIAIVKLFFIQYIKKNPQSLCCKHVWSNVKRTDASLRSRHSVHSLSAC